MRRLLLKWFVVPLFLWASVSCKYYQYRPDVGLDRWAYQTFDEEEWQRIDEGYFFVIHYQQDTLELYDVGCENFRLLGKTRAFTGLPLEYYKASIDYPGENIKRPFFGESGPATNQIHFFVDRLTQLDSNRVGFSVNYDLSNVDFVKQSPKNYIGGLAFVAAIVIPAYVSLGLFFMWAAYDE